MREELEFCKQILGEEVRAITNSVGLDRVGWDGTELYLFLVDKSIIAVKIGNKEVSVGVVNENKPTLLFVHVTQPLKKTTTNAY